jgi:hypothetical protein
MMDENVEAEEEKFEYVDYIDISYQISKLLIGKRDEKTIHS